MLKYFKKLTGNFALSPVALKLNILSGVMLSSLPAISQLQLADSVKNKKTPDQVEKKSLSMELYGFILTDVIYDFKQMDPKWYDVPRPTKLPAYRDQFAPDGQLYFSVRQTRFGVKGYTQTPIGTLSTLFEFDMFGSGADAGQTTIHLRHAYGIESYVRDAPTDIGIKTLGTNSIEGVALPVTGFVGFYDHYWNSKFSSTIGYSSVKINNSNGQSPSAFKMGQYALTDLVYTPSKDAIFEMELQYLNRKNFSDGWTTTDPRIQFSFRFNFSQKFYHEINTAQ